jgi:hypothetical protein
VYSNANKSAELLIVSRRPGLPSRWTYRRRKRTTSQYADMAVCMTLYNTVYRSLHSNVYIMSMFYSPVDLTAEWIEWSIYGWYTYLNNSLSALGRARIHIHMRIESIRQYPKYCILTHNDTALVSSELVLYILTHTILLYIWWYVLNRLDGWICVFETDICINCYVRLLRSMTSMISLVTTTCRLETHST